MAKQLEIRKRSREELYSLGLLKTESLEELNKKNRAQVEEQVASQRGVAIPDALYKGLKELERTYSAPSEYISKGIEQLQDNPLAGAINVGQGIVHGAFALTGIPQAFISISTGIRSVFGDEQADTFDNILDLPATGVREATRQLDKVFPKELQQQFVTRQVQRLIATGRPEFLSLAPLLTEGGQQELADAIDEVNQLSATLLGFKALHQTSTAIKSKAGIPENIKQINKQGGLKGFEEGRGFSEFEGVTHEQFLQLEPPKGREKRFAQPSGAMRGDLVGQAKEIGALELKKTETNTKIRELREELKQAPKERKKNILKELKEQNIIFNNLTNEIEIKTARLELDRKTTPYEDVQKRLSQFGERTPVKDIDGVIADKINFTKALNPMTERMTGEGKYQGKIPPERLAPVIRSVEDYLQDRSLRLFEIEPKTPLNQDLLNDILTFAKNNGIETEVFTILRTEAMKRGKIREFEDAVKKIKEPQPKDVVETEYTETRELLPEKEVKEAKSEENVQSLPKTEEAKQNPVVEPIEKVDKQVEPTNPTIERLKSEAKEELKQEPIVDRLEKSTDVNIKAEEPEVFKMEEGIGNYNKERKFVGQQLDYLLNEFSNYKDVEKDKLRLGRDVEFKIGEFKAKLENPTYEVLTQLRKNASKTSEAILNQNLREELKSRVRADLIYTPERGVNPNAKIDVDAVNQARVNIISKTLGRTNMGFDPTIIKDYAVIGKYHLENIIRSGIEKGKHFAELMKRMVAEFGERVKPYVLRVWNEIKAYATGEKQLTSQGSFGMLGAGEFSKQKSKEQLVAEFKQNFKERESIVYRAKESVLTVLKESKQSVKNTLEAVSTTIEKMSPELFRKLKDHEYNIVNREFKANQVMTKWLDKMKDAKLKRDDIAEFSAYLANFERFSTDAYAFANKHNFLNEFNEVMKAKDRVANELGVKMIKNHFPKMVKDYQGLRKELFERMPEYKTVFLKIIADAEAKRGKMTEEQQINYLNNALRGYNPRIAGIPLSDVGNMKKRVLHEMDGVLAKYYHDPLEAVGKYLYEMNKLAAEKQFFGKGGFDLDQSVAFMLVDLERQGKLKDVDMPAVKDLLRARFNERGITSKLLQTIRDFGIATKLMNPLASLTQVKDLGFSLAISPTEMARSMGTAIKDRIFKERTGISFEDIGYDPMQIAHELSNVGGRTRFMDAGLRVAGFTNMDFIGKEVKINTVYRKYRRDIIKDPNNPELNRKLEKFFGNGEEKAKVIQDLKSGKITDSVGFLLFNEIAETQAISLIDMPKNYLTAGNGRIFYFLKTFGIRQMNFIMNETLNVIRNKNLPKEQRLQGYKNFFKIVPSLLLAGATVDEIREWILNLTGTRKEEGLPERVTDNLLNMALLSRYDISGIGKSFPEKLAGKALPPTDWIGDALADASKVVEGKLDKLESIKQIPLIGRLIHQWFVKEKQGAKALGRPKVIRPTISKPQVSKPLR